MLAAALNTLIGGGQRANPLLFSAPLTASLIPTKGIGSPTFTRNSTATVVDHEGVIRNCKANEARFYGARRVENLLTFSDPTTGVGMTNTPVGFYAEGGCTWDAQTRTATFVAGGTPIVRTGTVMCRNVAVGEVIGRYWDVELLSGGTSWRISSFGSSTKLNNNANITLPLGQRVRVFAPVTISGSGSVTLNLIYMGTGTAQVRIYDAQMEAMTGVSDPGRPSELVDALTEYGANVPGVRYFDYANGNTVDANGVVTEAQGAPLATCHGVLIEGTRTNSVPYSENVALWVSTSDFTLTPSAAVAPDGQLAATLAVIGSAGTGTLTTQTVAVPASTNVAISVMLKRYDNDWVCIKINGGSNQVNATFNLATGVVGAAKTPAGTAIYDSHYIEALPNGWYRCVVVGQFADLTSASLLLYPATGDVLVRQPSTGFYVWGAQMEIGTRFASSYIPTNGAAASRASDVLTYPRANIHDAKGSSRMTFTSYVASAQYNQAPMCISTGISGRRLPGMATGGRPALEDGANQSLLAPMVPANAFGSISVGGRWDATGMHVFAGGSAGSEVAYDGSFDGSVMSVGSGNPSVDSTHAYGMIKDVRLWKAKLSAAKLQELTA